MTAAERGGLVVIEGGLHVVSRRCAAIACLLGGLGVAFSMVPLFFGLAWNFGGLATCLAAYAHHRRSRGDRRISRRAADAGLVLGVSAVVLGCVDLVVVLSGL